ncbi:MAG TPA: hypothetical protein VIJ94_05565 [Caulobacteraceae bacterium]
MRIAFLASDKAREQHLADAFLMGARKHGHTTEVRTLGPDLDVSGYDVACMVGVKSRELFHLHRQQGITTIYLDKGYARHKRPGEAGGWEYWRVSINAHHPTRRLAVQRHDGDRLAKLDWRLRPRRGGGRHIVFAGSSQKYHDFYGLRGATDYAKRLVREMHLLVPQRRIVYRPKPSWADAEPVKGADFSRLPQTIDDVLGNAWCMVTHGSNACFESVCAGIPVVVLGDAVAKPISSTELEDVRAPFLATDEARRQWLANLAYWQWTLAEMASGEAWAVLGEEIHAS